ncbi:hypothetical protein [Micromonospora sp. NBC_01412]|uniref:hypothetical protein n=1 Tax=Micromonospora sp. NBC_01412 TaxID=2903590 RepID=UPI00324815A8
MSPLEDWLEGMQPRLTGLLDFELSEGDAWDYSAASLARLEAEMLSRFVPTPDFLERVSGYLGEALLTAGGGRWAWDPGRGLPLVLPDEALALPPVCPADLVERALAAADGGEFGRAYRALELAVVERRAAEPGWEPHKEPTPGLDEVPGAMPSAELDTWLAVRKETWAAWLAEYGERPERWDFSVASLDELEALLLRLVSAPEELAARAELSEGAAWYLGEVLRPVLSAHWCYFPGDPDGENMFIGRPFLKQPVPNGRMVVPFVLLKGVLARREPGLLRQVAERLT